MGDVINMQEWPTAVRDRRRFYLRDQPLDETALPPRTQRRLTYAVWFFRGERPLRATVDDVDRLVRSPRGRRLLDLVDRHLQAQLLVWYSAWALVDEQV